MYCVLSTIERQKVGIRQGLFKEFVHGEGASTERDHTIQSVER